MNVYLINNDISVKNNNLLEIVKNFKDHQFIKPRVFGTLEFRSAPSQKSPNSIIELCFFRYAQALLALNEKIYFKTLNDAHHFIFDDYMNIEVLIDQIIRHVVTL